MFELPGKLQWHPAFYAAAAMEFRENIDQIEMKPEYNLSNEPIRIDLLIVNHENDVPIKNEIGHLMRRYNIIEYKSPGDGLTIDDFYKGIGYACLYKGYGKTVDQIQAEELTVSFFRDTYPQELFQKLREIGYEIIQHYDGIYYVAGDILLSVQIIVTSQLKAETHSSMRILSRHAQSVDVEQFLYEAERAEQPWERAYVDAILQVSIRANPEIYEAVRRKSEMCEALEWLMKDVIDERVETAVQTAVQNTTIKTVTDTTFTALRRMMTALHLSADTAMDVLEIPQSERPMYRERLNAELQPQL